MSLAKCGIKIFNSITKKWIKKSGLSSIIQTKPTIYQGNSNLRYLPSTHNTEKKYLKKNLLDGIYNTANPQKFIKMRSCFTEPTVNVPLSCFTRTADDKIVLYRGLKNVPLDKNMKYSQSAAGMSGNLPKINRKSEIDLARDYSGLTQGKDPVLHTTTRKSTAKTFAVNGVLIEYHIPKSVVQNKGIVGHLGENEIDFIGNINEKYIAKITKTKPTGYFESGLPLEINITI